MKTYVPGAGIWKLANLSLSGALTGGIGGLAVGSGLGALTGGGLEYLSEEGAYMSPSQRNRRILRKALTGGASEAVGKTKTLKR